jgi:hypothetical protein
MVVANTTVVLSTFMIKGNAKFQLKDGENKNGIFPIPIQDPPQFYSQTPGDR